MKRVKSGIHNFDRLLGGGIPERELLLVEGQPGTGKTNLGLEFLYRGAENGESGLFMSFQDTKNEVLRTTTFDWNFKEYVDDGTIKITNFDPYRYESIADMLRTAIIENDAKRVVLDPITDLDIYIDTRKDQRKTLLEVKNELRDLKCTSLLMAEQEESTEIEEEIADGIINMEIVREEGQMKRRIYVKKLKGSDFAHAVHPYVFEPDGLHIK